MTAPTGVAACNVRGLTLHSWAGIGVGHETLEALFGIVMKNTKAQKRWKETEILVIDEISMLSAELFDKLDMIGRRIRGNLVPFGGLQLILCGDFFQLPPIGVGKNTSFCFESSAWKELFGCQDVTNQGLYVASSMEASSSPLGEVILLDKVFRQRDDVTFLNVLNMLRKGQVTYQVTEVLTRKVHESQLLKRQEEEEEQMLARMKATSDNNTNMEEIEKLQAKIRPTKLFSTNSDVDNYNLKELERLMAEDDPVQYNAFDEGRDPYLSQLRAGTKAPQMLMLKHGAQVMLLKNLDSESGLVNGTRGTVIGFERNPDRASNYRTLPVVKFQMILGGVKSECTQTIKEESWDIKQGDK